MGLIRLALSVVLGPPLFLLAALCAGAAAAAQQGRTSLRWDILAHFAPLWFAGSMVCALVALIALSGLSRLLIGAVGAAGVVFAGMLIAPELTRSTGPRAGADAPGSLKVIQFNVWHENPNPRASIDWLVAQDPDIAVIEETTPEFRALAREAGKWRISCPNCEVMILSRQTPTAEGRVFKGPGQGPISQATFGDARGAFTVIGVHEAWPTDADQPMQEARLSRAIGMFGRERTIVAGDFNSAPWSFQRRKWDAAFGLTRRERAIFTWPATAYKHLDWLTTPILPIDHIYAGPGWATVSVARGPKLGSDHYPLVAILAPVAPR